jgi:hypothetical protein
MLAALPAFSSTSVPVKKTGSFKAWLPTLAALALVGCSAFFASTAGPAPERHLLVREHHEAVFGASPVDEPKLGWFTAKKPPSQFTASTGEKRSWGTARAYPPPVDEASGRALYEAHVDVSDQFRCVFLDLYIHCHRCSPVHRVAR